MGSIRVCKHCRTVISWMDSICPNCGENPDEIENGEELNFNPRRPFKPTIKDLRLKKELSGKNKTI